MPFDCVPPYDSDPELRVLRAAQNLIRDQSWWCKGTLADKAGRYCAVGAIDHAVAHLHYSSRTGRKVIDRVASHIPRQSIWRVCRILSVSFGSRRDIMVYNDHRNRMHSEIIQLFTSAIAQRETELMRVTARGPMDSLGVGL